MEAPEAAPAATAPTKKLVRRTGGPGTAVKENRYAPYEAKLDSRGATYQYVGQVPLADITRYADAQSRVRLSGKDMVTRYAEAMKQGEIFPPMVLGEDGTGDYMLLDGNTRKAAMESLSRTHTDAYIVQVHDTNEAVYLSALFNGINGAPLTKDEVLRAIRAAHAMPIPPTPATLAKDLGLSPSKISRIASVDAYDSRATRLGLPTDISEDMKLAISPVADDTVFSDLLTLTMDADLKGKDIRPIVKELATKGSESDRRAVVADERTDRQTVIQQVAAGRTTTAPPAKDSLMTFGRIHTLMGKFPSPTDWVPVRQESRDDWYPKIQEIEAFLGTLLTAYEAAGITP
jgi:ParB-like chromosome segregation protein Spo0J